MKKISTFEKGFWDRKAKEEAARMMKAKIEKGYEATAAEVMEMNKWLPVEEMVKPK